MESDGVQIPCLSWYHQALTDFRTIVQIANYTGHQTEYCALSWI